MHMIRARKTIKKSLRHVAMVAIFLDDNKVKVHYIHTLSYFIDLI